MVPKNPRQQHRLKARQFTLEDFSPHKNILRIFGSIQSTGCISFRRRKAEKKLKLSFHSNMWLWNVRSHFTWTTWKTSRGFSQQKLVEEDDDKVFYYFSSEIRNFAYFGSARVQMLSRLYPANTHMPCNGI